jgi:protein tyrosine/serine phosphatase
MPRVFRLLLLWLVVITCLLLPTDGDAADPPVRPRAWAVKIERPGLPNLHRINGFLYRGAQPTAEGIKELQRLGFKTIVNLRANHSDKEILGKANLGYEAIPMNTWDVKDDDVVRFLRIITDKSRQPVFVHCEHGADRTGTMCAAYRVVIDGWTKQQAIDEMTKGGFGYHSIWTNLLKIIEKLDVERTKAKLGQKDKRKG